MKHRKLFKIVLGLLIIIVVVVAVIQKSHPIVLKWLSGSARVIGRPISAKVYTNGLLNHDIRIFHVEKYWHGEPADYYILYFPYADGSRLKFLSLNKKDNYAGGPSSTNIADYDIVWGRLLQSEVGAKFTPMQDDIKGFDHDPQLIFTNQQITLILPPAASELRCDSLRVVL